VKPRVHGVINRNLGLMGVVAVADLDVIEKLRDAVVNIDRVEAERLL